MAVERIPKGKFTREFREEAVRMVVEDKLSVPEVGRRLQVPEQTIRNWVKAHKEGKLGSIGKGQREMTILELENHRLKRELAQVKMERDILKNRHKGGAFSCDSRNLSGYTIGGRRGRLLSGVIYPLKNMVQE